MTCSSPTTVPAEALGYPVKLRFGMLPVVLRVPLEVGYRHVAYLALHLLDLRDCAHAITTRPAKEMASVRLGHSLFA